MISRPVILLVALLFASLCAQAAEPLTKFGIVLLQPDVILQQRVPSVEALGAYIGAVEQAARSAIVANSAKQPAAGFLVLAVRPGQRANLWLDFEPALAPALKDKVAAMIKSVQAFPVREGPVVFAIKVGVWGGAEPSRTAPSPAEWKAAAQKAGRPLEVGELVETIWRE